MTAAPVRRWPAGAARVGGYGMRRFGRCFALFCLFAVLLSTTALANSAAPDYRVAVRVVNGPEEIYYLDLLEKSDGDRLGSPPEGLDPELLEAVEQAEPEGWRSCTLSIMEDYFKGDIAGKNGIHIFHGLDTPRMFRILIVTKSGESWVSEPMERQLMNSTVKVDWEKKTAVMPPVQILYVLQFLSTLLPTLAIEGLIFWLFRFSGKRNWLVFLLVNLVTQGLLSVVLCMNIVGSGGRYVGVTMLVLIPAEMLIALAEAACYMKLLRGQEKHKAFAYGITANVVSYVAGLFIVGPLYNGIVALTERIF